MAEYGSRNAMLSVEHVGFFNISSKRHSEPRYDYETENGGDRTVTMYM